MRKPRPSGPLNQLSPEKRERLHGWFAENLTFSRIRALMLDELGVTTSETALGEYYQKHGCALLVLGGEAAKAASQGQGVTVNIKRIGPRSVQIIIENLPEGLPALTAVLEAALLTARSS